MALVKLDHVLKLMEDKELPCWTIKDRASIVGEQENEGMAIRDSMQALQDAIECFESGVLNVQVSGLSRKNKGAGGNLKSGAGKTFEFQIRAGNTASINGSNASGLNSELMRMLEKNFELQKQIIDIQRGQEVTELQRQFNEFKEKKGKKEVSSHLDNAIGSIVTLLPQIAAKYLNEGQPVNPVLNGTDSPVDVSAAEERKTQFDKAKIAFGKMLRLDPNFGDNLSMIAEFAELNIASYKAFIPMLQAQVNNLKA